MCPTNPSIWAHGALKIKELDLHHVQSSAKPKRDVQIETEGIVKPKMA
jgi:hypothetical protein